MTIYEAIAKFNRANMMVKATLDEEYSRENWYAITIKDDCEECTYFFESPEEFYEWYNEVENWSHC